jgi:hypothetical protein
MISSGDIFACILALPLLASLSLTLWPVAWGERSESPLSGPAHAALMTAQAAVVVVLAVATGSVIAFWAAAGLYLAMATGSAVLRIRLGSVSCGCWGERGGHLSWRLVGTNLLFAGASLFAAVDSLHRSWSVAESLAVFLGLAAATVTLGLVLPEWRFAYRGIAMRADRYRDWVRGFPELRP